MLSTLKKRNVVGEEEVEAKKRKGFGYSIRMKLRLQGKFEIQRNVFTPVSEIMELLSADESEKENLSRHSLGRIIQDTWGYEGVRLKKVGRRNEKPIVGYFHLGKIEDNRGNCNLSTTTAVDGKSELDVLQNSTADLVNWTPVRNNPTSLSFVRVEPIAFDNHRLTTEISFSVDDVENNKLNLQVICRGFILPLMDLEIDQQLETLSSNLSKVKLLAQFIDSSNLCSGFLIGDEDLQNKLLPDRVVHRVSYTANPSQPSEKRMFSTKCKVLAPSIGQYCSNCAHTKRNEAKRMQRQELKSDNRESSDHTNHRYMSEQQLNEKLCQRKKDMKNCQAREIRWKEKFEEQLLEMEKEDHDDLSRIMESQTESNIPRDMQMLWEQQKRILQTNSSKGYRWHPKIIQLCLDLYCKNPHVLDSLRQVMYLPSNRTIRLYKNKREQKPGWQRDVIDWCYSEAKKKKLNSCDFWGGFVIDEMKIEENVEMLVKSGRHRLVGFVELGSIHDDMQTLEGKDGEKLASHVLQFIFSSDCGFRFPIAQFPSHDCTPSDLFFIFWKGVRMMKEFGFNIYWCILDGAECNRKFIKMHFPDYDAVGHKFTAFNMHSAGKPMVFIVDCKHNIKKIRNNLEKSNVDSKPRCLTKGNKQILWSHLVSAYNYDQMNTSLHIHEKLTEQHFNLDPALKMRNHLAEDVLDKKMLYLMKVYKKHLTDSGKDGNILNATLELLQFTSSLIEFFCNSKQAVSTISDPRIKDLDRFLVFLAQWQAESHLNKMPKHFFSDKLWFDMQSMIHGFKAVVKIKLTQFPDSVIKAWLLNQDVVENHFCQVRACNGQNNNPTYKLQETTQNSIRYGQLTISQKSNVGIQKQ